MSLFVKGEESINQVIRLFAEFHITLTKEEHFVDVGNGVYMVLPGKEHDAAIDRYYDKVNRHTYHGPAKRDMLWAVRSNSFNVLVTEYSDTAFGPTRCKAREFSLNLLRETDWGMVFVAVEAAGYNVAAFAESVLEQVAKPLLYERFINAIAGAIGGGPTGAATGAATGTVGGAVVGSVVPGPGTVAGAGAGFVGGTITGFISGVVSGAITGFSNDSTDWRAALLEGADAGKWAGLMAGPFGGAARAYARLLLAKAALQSFDDIVANPLALCGKSADEVAGILGQGWTRSKYGVTGTGWKFTKGDKMVFYHEGGRHGGWGCSHAGSSE